MKKLLLMVFALLFFTSSVIASYEDMGFGARASSLGIMYIGLSDDVSAVYYNPAGSAQFKQNKVMVSFTRLYWGLGKDNPIDEENSLYSLSAGYVHNLNIIHLGIGYHRFALDNYYNENTVILSASTELKKLIKSLKKINLSIGLNFKLLTKSYAEDIYTSVNTVFVNNGYNKTGYSTDLGFLYKMEQLSIGAAIENIYSSDMGLQNEDRINRRISIGAAYTFEGKYLVKNATWLNELIPLVGIKLDDGSDIIGGVGAEVWFLNTGKLGFRTSFQMGSGEYYALNLGLSFKTSIFKDKITRIDYGFTYPLAGIDSTYGTHRIGLNFRF